MARIGIFLVLVTVIVLILVIVIVLILVFVIVLILAINRDRPAVIESYVNSFLIPRKESRDGLFELNLE